MNIRTLSALIFALLIHASIVSSTTSPSSLSTPASSSTFPTTTSSMSQRPSNATTSFDLRAYLPPAWTTFCDVYHDVDTDVNTTLRCNVTESDVWRLQDFREALGALVNSTGIEVAVYLQCQEGGVVSLPWPMRAPGLVKLKVTSCLLLDKYADFNTSAEQIPDSLRFLDMLDCDWLNYPDEVDNLIDNAKSVTSDYDCGQDSTLVVYRYRRIADKDIRREDECNLWISSALQLLNYSLSFPEDAGEVFQWSDERFEEFVNNTNGLGEDYAFCANLLASFRSTPRMTDENPGPLDVQTTTVGPLKGRTGLNEIDTHCVFEHLEILDESLTNPLDRKHFEYLVKNTEYPKLRVLNYSHTNLGEVPREVREWRVFFNESLMELVDLSHNIITEVGNIPDYTSTHGNVTTTLNLQFNHIAKISFQMFEAWSWVRNFVVDIRNNPIDCSCNMPDLKDLVTQIQDDSKWAEQPMQTYRQHLSVMRCATPPALSGRAIDLLNAEDWQCDGAEAADVANYVFIPVVVGLVVVVIVLFVLLMYRKEVRILLFTRVHIMLPCGSTVLNKGPSEKVFDAFVAYAHQDSDWVLDSLLKRLEEPSNARGCEPLKLCIHQRDFVVGKPIIDNIIDSIAASRHTIIVLSKSFAKSSWAMEELHQAYRQSLEERRRHLLVVRLEEVPKSDMAPVLRRCCKTFTYIQASEPFFWDRLQYSLHVADNKKIRTSAEYDNATFSASEDETSDKHTTVQMETSTGDINDNSGFSKTEVFCEEMKTLPVDANTCSATGTVSETYRRVNPNEVKVDFS